MTDMTVRCPVCHQPFGPRGLPIHMGLRHKPRPVEQLDVERLARALDAAFAGGVADTNAVARVVSREYAVDPLRKR